MWKRLLSLHDALDGALLMSGREDERRAVCADRLVLDERRLDAARAVRVRALAYELCRVGLESLRALGDALVHIPEERLDPGPS